MKSRILLVTLLLILLVSCASATVQNATSGGKIGLLAQSYNHDVNTMPVTEVYVIMIIGFALLVLSRAIQASEDVLSVLALIPSGVSAYWATHMSYDYVSVIGSIDSNSTTMVYTQVLQPNPYLQIIGGALTLACIINIAWIFYLRDADKKTDGSSDSGKQGRV